MDPEAGAAPAGSALSASSAPPPAPPAPLAPAQPDPLSRLRTLQVISIALVLGGVGMVVAAILLRAGRLDADLPADQAVYLGFLALGGGLLAIVGLVMNAVRAVVVREALPPNRYRGPAIFVLLALATLLSVIGSVTVAGDILALEGGGSISIFASLVILTVTQAGLVAAAVLFVAVPGALPGVRLLPASGALRTFALGVGLAVPLWVAATLVGALLEALLSALGHPTTPGLVDDAVSRLDPTVLVLAIVIIAPIAEEIFFRGVVFNAWLREYGAWVAILGSAALFATIHADPSNGDTLIASIARVLPIFGLGLGLAYVYWRTGSLLASIGLHMGFNAVSLGIALAARLGLLPSF